MHHSTLPAENPFAAPSALPYELPDFSAVRTEHLRPALQAGLEQQRQEWEQIATDPAPATVANTLEAVERSGRLLQRVEAVLQTLLGSMATDDLRALETEFAPVLAVHRDGFWLDSRIHDRMSQVDAEGVDDAETRWVLDRYLQDFDRAGIHLGAAEKEQLRELNARITSLETEFSQRVVTGMEAAAVAVADQTRLVGMAQSTREALARAAEDRGRTGCLITMQLPTDQAILTELQDRSLRAQVHGAATARGGGDDRQSDTRRLVLGLARARSERAQLLGYRDHSSYVAEASTAASVSAINDVLRQLAPAARRNADAEQSDLQAALTVEEPGAELAPWDWQYYAERVRRDRYAVEESQLRPYLELDRVLHDGVFFAAACLYGITVTERHDLPGYADDVRVFEVTDHDGSDLGLFVADYFTRPGKRGGAWMHNLVEASTLLDQRAVVVNNLNIARPTDGEPVLLTWDEVTTAFHEFGHALHSLFAQARYPSVSGTNVPRDFVEYPSQVNEIWAWHPRVLANFARHHRTGAPLPQETLQELQAAQSFGDGFGTTEYLAAAIVDQAWHQLTPQQVPAAEEDVAAFEHEALRSAGMDHPLVPPRYRSTYFNHTFGGGYDAGYYSYIWSEVLDADTAEWFRTEAARDGDGGLNRTAGDRFRQALLSRGDTRDPLDSYRDLRGRDAVIEPLLNRRGLN